MIPRFSDTPFEARSDETRARIFENTVKLVQLVGVERLTVRRIAEEAGVSPALIIQYFGSKDQLLQKIFEENNAGLIDDIRTAVAEIRPKTLHDCLMTLTRFLLTRDLKRPSLTLHVMSHAFRWSKDEERGFLVRLEPFILVVAEAFRNVDETLTVSESRTATEAFFMCYSQAVRIILKQEIPMERAIAYLSPHMKLLACGIEHRNT